WNCIPPRRGRAPLSGPAPGPSMNVFTVKRSQAMKKGIHPNYRPVVFQDAAANFSFLTQSCVETDETIKWADGKEYPLYKLDISSASHPFFTGKMKLVDTTG